MFAVRSQPIRFVPRQEGGHFLCVYDMGSRWGYILSLSVFNKKCQAPCYFLYKYICYEENELDKQFDVYRYFIYSVWQYPNKQKSIVYLSKTTTTNNNKKAHAGG